MNETQYSLSAMEEAKNEIIKCSDNLAKASDELLKTISSIKISGFKGSDADAFVSNAETIKGKLDETVEKLKEDAKILETQANGYQEARDSIIKNSTNLEV